MRVCLAHLSCILSAVRLSMCWRSFRSKGTPKLDNLLNQRVEFPYLTRTIFYSRYFIIYKPMRLKNMRMRTVFLTISACICGGLLWSVLPLLGWSYYDLEGAGTSCSVKWEDRSLNVMSYNITIFILVFLFPFIVIFIANLKLAFLVKQKKSC